MGYTRVYNAAVDMVDSHISAGRTAKIAFIDPTRQITYGALKLETNRVAHMLLAFGLQRENRVALLLTDTIDFPVCFWGAIKAGIVPVPLNTLLTADQYAYILGDARANALIVSSALLPLVQPLLKDLPNLTHVIVAGDEAPAYGFTLATELGRHATTFTPVETSADEVAFWLYSSGSTGAPKGARHVHTSMMDTARLYGQGVLGITANDVVFSAAKLFFAYGLGNGMSFPMSVGATTILMPDRPTPESVIKTLKDRQPTIFCGVPTLYAALLANSECRPDNGSKRLRLCISAGEALPADIGRTWQQRFNIDILDGIGSTEMLHIYVSNTATDLRYGTSGKAVPGYDVRLVDEKGAPPVDGEVGEMLVSGPTAADGYWNQRAKSRATFEGAWLRTGDKYTQSRDGYYTYAGRTDDMFKVSGIWVSPFEVESALIGHTDVLEAAVVPAEDLDGLTKPKAFVVLKASATVSDALERALKDHVKNACGTWKYPRWIVFTDALPKTATGKIQRYKLRGQ
jgi:4-hydroxybenzoate-CoA ligase